MTDERKALMLRLQQASFALWETMLFLDTHPDDAEALKYFAEIRQKSRELTAQYEKKYGPVTAEATYAGAHWNWVDGPWPWQTERSGMNNVDL